MRLLFLLLLLALPNTARARTIISLLRDDNLVISSAVIGSQLLQPARAERGAPAFWRIGPRTGRRMISPRRG
ncbi:MAG: hypothetical protein WD775_13560 [Burkholderiales bacterium]